MCDEGAGAVCFFETVSDLKVTCAKVDRIKAKEDYNDVNSVMTDFSGAGSGYGDGYGWHDDIGDGGCDRHSYCENCDNYCQDAKLVEYLKKTYDVHSPYSPTTLKQVQIPLLACTSNFRQHSPIHNQTLCHVPGLDQHYFHV